MAVWPWGVPICAEKLIIQQSLFGKVRKISGNPIKTRKIDEIWVKINEKRQRGKKWCKCAPLDRATSRREFELGIGKIQEKLENERKTRDFQKCSERKRINLNILLIYKQFKWNFPGKM